MGFIGGREINPYFGTAITNFLLMAFTLGQGAIMARMLGPEGRGVFQAATYYPVLFAGIGVVGVTAALARTASRIPEQEDLTATALIVAFFTSSIAAFMCWILLPSLLAGLGGETLDLAKLFTLFIPINHVSGLLQSIDQGRRAFGRYNTVRLILNPVFIVGLVLTWLFASDKVYWSVFSLLAANFAAVMVRLYARRCAWGCKFPIKHELRAFLGDSVNFFVVGVAAALFQQADKVIALNSLSASQVGIYTVASSAASVVSVLNVSLSTVMFSDGMRNARGDGVLHLGRVVRAAILVSICIGFVFSFVAPYLFVAVYGPEFSEGIPVLFVMIPAVLLASISVIFDEHFRGGGRPYIGALLSGFGGCLVLLGAHLSIPTFGFVGLSLSYLVSVFFVLVAFVCFAKKEFSCSVLNFIPGVEDVRVMYDFLCKVILKLKRVG